MSLKLDWCDYKTAKWACENWHYSRSIPAPPMIRIGVWEDDMFKGVIIYSRGASSNLGKPYKLKTTEVCELTRIALKEHTNPVSKMMAISKRLIRKTNPGLKLIVSYADPNQGHEGKIYKADNWIFDGTTAKTYHYIDGKGKKWHSRQVSEKGWNLQFGQYRRTKKPSELNRVEEKPKIRYLYFLDDKIKEQYLRQQSKSKTAGFHSAKGGAVPTLAHQVK